MNKEQAIQVIKELAEAPFIKLSLTEHATVAKAIEVLEDDDNDDKPDHKAQPFG